MEATTVIVQGEHIITLDSKEDWIRKCPRRLPVKKHSKEQWVWVDKNGFSLQVGEDFYAAEAQESYPVRVFRLIRTIENK